MPAHDEELREALLELQVLRQREARALRESNTLLQVLEGMTAAQTPDDAIASLLSTVRNVTDAAGAVIARPVEDALILSHAAPQDWAGARLTLPVHLGKKARNLVDLQHDPALRAGLPADLSDQRSMISVPLPRRDGTHDVLICLKPGRAAFDQADMTLLQRIAQLAGQALRSLDLDAERSLLGAVIAGSPTGFAISDTALPDNPLVYVNPAFERITGYTRDEVLGLNCRFLSAEKPNTPTRSQLRETIAQKREGRFLIRNRRKWGEEFWNELSIFPVTQPDKTVRYLVATQIDATDTVATRNERDTARRHMEVALTNTADAFLLIDADRAVAFANDRVRDLFPAPGLDWRPGTGFDENWAAVLTTYDSDAKLSKAARSADLSGLLDQPEGAEFPLPDGRAGLLRARPTDGGGMVLTATDVTPLKTAETMLRQRAVAIESAEDGIAIADPDGTLVYLNSSFAKMIRRRPGAPLLGTDWISHYMPDDRAQYGPRIARGLRDKGRAKAMLRRQRGPEDFAHHELTLTRVDDVGIVIVARDVSDRIRDNRERTRLRSELNRARQQEAIAQLTAGIAHDFNNLLSAINGSAQLITMDAQTPPTLQPHADRIIAAGNRAARMVNRLLDLGSGGGDGRADAQLTDLRDTLTEALELVRPSLRSNLTMTVAPGDQALMVMANPTELIQLIVNLMINAQDAIEDGDPGQIALDLSCQPPAPGLQPQVGKLAPDLHYARLRVADTGSGIPPDILAKVFAPYFSTKGDQGTGLGLAMAARIVTAAKGAIHIVSTAGQGTQFDIYLPCLSDTLCTTPPVETPRALDSGATLRGAPILIVDDDPRVGEVMGAYLESLGAEVSVTDDPDLALESLQEDPDLWAALITDYDMPRMDGGALAQAARAIRADLPIFLVTALARRLSDPRVAPGNVTGIFAKPVDLRQFASAVAKALPPSGTSVTAQNEETGNI